MRRNSALCVLAAALTAVAAGCGSTSRGFSREEVQAAFSAVGLQLRVGIQGATQPPRRWSGTLLVGDAGSALNVIVYSSARSAQEAFRTQQSQARASSFDRVLVNVLVTSDGLSRLERQRVLAALAELRRSVPPYVTGGPRCAPGQTHPIAKSQLMRVLGAHGLRLEPDPSSELCSAEDVGLVLTNEHTTEDDVGVSACILRLGPIYRTAAPWIVSKGDFGRKIELEPANAECTIYPRGAAGRKQAAALEAALTEIRHSIDHAAGETQPLYTPRDVQDAFGGVGLSSEESVSLGKASSRSHLRVCRFRVGG